MGSGTKRQPPDRIAGRTGAPVCERGGTSIELPRRADRTVMRKQTAALVAALALVATAPLAESAASSPIAHASCTNARIQGQSKCIAAGQYCKHTARANRDYHKYG